MNRPQPDLEKLPDLEFDFSFRKLIASMLAITLFLIVPIVGIETLNNPGRTENENEQFTATGSLGATQGQVAGVSTTANSNEALPAESFISLFGMKINLNSQAGLFIIGGILLLGIALILILYLIIDSLKQKNIYKIRKRRF